METVISLFLMLLPLLVIFYLANRAVALQVPIEQRSIPIQDRPSLYEKSLRLIMYIIVVFFLLFSFMNGLLIHPAVAIPPIIGFILFIPSVRRIIARWISIQPDNQVHTMALVISMLLIFQLFTVLFQGLETIGMEEPSSSLMAILEMWVQDIMFFLLGCIGVGWLTRREAGEVFERLGLIRPTGKMLLLGVGCAIGLVGIAIGLEHLGSAIGLGVDPEVQRITEELLGPVYSTVPGIITLGLAAAIGEETIFRGALQPRFGIILTSILFAAIHTNYGLTLSTLIVLILAFVLGWLRLRYSTTLTMIVHATYNIILGVLSYIGLQ